MLVFLILISTIVVHGVSSAAALGVMYDNTLSEKHMLYGTLISPQPLLVARRLYELTPADGF